MSYLFFFFLSSIIQRPKAYAQNNTLQQREREREKEDEKSVDKQNKAEAEASEKDLEEKDRKE